MADISSVLTAALPVAGSLISTSMKNDTASETARQKTEAAAELARQKAASAAAASAEAAAEKQAAKEADTTVLANTLKQKRDSDAADYADAAEDAAGRIAAYQQSYESDEADRQAALAKSLASARARLGAGGVGADDGSAAAVLDGLNADAARENAEAATELDLKKKAESDALDQLRSKSLLDESRLEEKQRLELLAKYG